MKIDQLTVKYLLTDILFIFYYAFPLWRFQSPLPGIYHLRRTGKQLISVNITAQSSITVDGEMLQNTGSGHLVSIKGSPVSGTVINT